MKARKICPIPITITRQEMIRTIHGRGFRFVAAMDAQPALADKNDDRPTLRRDVSNLPSIAVLPFVNMSNDSAQDYFVEALGDLRNQKVAL